MLKRLPARRGITDRQSFMRKSCMKSLCGLLALEGSAGAVGGMNRHSVRKH